MGPGTDGAPRILKSELPITPELRGWSLGLMGRTDFKIRPSYHPRTPRMESGTDGAPRISESELPINPELRGWGLGLMGRPGL